LAWIGIRGGVYSAIGHRRARILGDGPIPRICRISRICSRRRRIRRHGIRHSLVQAADEGITRMPPRCHIRGHLPVSRHRINLRVALCIGGCIGGRVEVSGISDPAHTEHGIDNGTISASVIGRCSWLHDQTARDTRGKEHTGGKKSLHRHPCRRFKVERRRGRRQSNL